MTDTTVRKIAHDTSFAVLFAIGFCHLLNDMMQALLPAIYPTLKTQFHLNFAQIGLVTLAFQCTASLFQPVVGYFADLKPMPYSLALGMVSTLVGLLVLAVAPSYPVILVAAMMIGLGSSVFHPESSRVARMASGGRYGLAQSVFQVGGNTGQAISPLTAALLVATYGQRSIVWYAGLALLGIVTLFNVGTWYKNHGLKRIKSHQAVRDSGLPKSKIVLSLTILLMLIFSKFFYLASIGSYYTFYLIHTFGVSVQNAQVHLFFFLGAVAVGTLVGGPLGDKIGRKYVIWFSILGMLPFTLMLPYANLFWTGILSVIIGLFMASAFPAIVVYAQELLPGRVGMISGLFFGFAFGMGGIGAAVLGALADATSITYVYKVCAFLPAIGLFAVFLPSFKAKT
ncbi:MAG TPA: MFS transporter [Rhizomicrobium sp.]|jgi:MFS transporter, FSR family, fosmidomycin resistance protein|nr:MFS transporter [Rhizomicrobium sp.]